LGETETIGRIDHPASVASLERDLRALGMQPGSIVLVHSSLSALGWVCGGPQAVIQALMETLTPKGTLIMPAHSGDLSDPGRWSNPPVPAEWWDEIRATMPAYHMHLTPTRGMGRIAELFRTWPDVQRSNHPQVSFAAWGKYAHQITASHALEISLGEGSPLARIYDLDGWVLLLGVGFGNNTSFHLSECRAGTSPLIQQGAPIHEDGRRTWKTFTDVDYDSDSFAEIGADFERGGEVTVGPVAAGQARLFRQRSAVDFAQSWLLDHQHASPRDASRREASRP
jgi:aminoglycoside 3-N-acetyltransferase